MQFGNNLLPQSAAAWTVDKAEITTGGTLILHAGGSASITLTSINGTNLLPEAFMVSVVASAYTQTYNPESFVCIRIIYEDNNAYDALLPIVNIDNGFSAILRPTISNYDIDVSAYKSITYSIYSSVEMTVGKYTLQKSLSDRLVEDKLYYGIQISTEKGLEITRDDGQAEALFNADTFAMRSKVNDEMKDAIYFDAIERKYKISGDVVIEGSMSSDANFTDALYAEQGDVSELVVDELSTSRKVLKFISLDWTDDNYQHIYTENSMPVYAWISAVSVKAYAAANGYKRLTTRSNTPLFWTDINMTHVTTTENIYPAYVKYEQAKNRYGDPLYWNKDIYWNGDIPALNDAGYPVASDGSQIYATTNETAYPVQVYCYTVQIKQQTTFEINAQGYYVPVTTYGVGNIGNTSPNGRATISKPGPSFDIKYVTEDGKEVSIVLSNDGFVDATMRRLKSCNIDTTNNTIKYRLEGNDTEFIATFNESTYGTTKTLTMTWDDGYQTSVSVTR